MTLILIGIPIFKPSVAQPMALHLNPDLGTTARVGWLLFGAILLVLEAAPKTLLRMLLVD